MSRIIDYCILGFYLSILFMLMIYESIEGFIKNCHSNKRYNWDSIY